MRTVKYIVEHSLGDDGNWIEIETFTNIILAKTKLQQCRELKNNLFYRLVEVTTMTFVIA